MRYCIPLAVVGARAVSVITPLSIPKSCRLRVVPKTLVAAALAIFASSASAQETVVTERSDTTRVANWFFTNQSEEQINRRARDLHARPIDIDVVSTNPMRFDVSFVADSGPHAATWDWRFDMTEAGLNSFADDTNSRVLDIETYVVDGQRLFAAIFKRNTGADHIDWRWGFDMSRDGMIDVYERHNMRLIDIERYRVDGRTLYAAVMVDNTGAHETDWNWFRDQTLQGVVSNMRDTNMRVLDIERHGSGSNTRFTSILVPWSPGQRAWHYYGITRAEVTHMLRRHGSRVIDIERAGNGRFDVQLLDNGYARSGHCGGRLRHFGQAMRDLMKENAIPGGQIAVVKDDRLVYSCAYGLADVDTLERVTPASRFRVMSVSKLLTLSAIMHLDAAGDLDIDDTMLEALGDRAPDGPFNDPRMALTRVNDLIQMDAGFLPADRYDATLNQPAVAADMGETAPLSCFQIMQYAIKDFTLSYDPGGREQLNPPLSFSDAYSNLSYCILQQIVRGASGVQYQTYVRDEILAPAGVTAMAIGRGQLADRKEGEVVYYDQPFASLVTSQYPQDPDPVPRPYSYVVEAMAGHGGWIASANDLVRYAAFTPTDPGGATTFFGSLNGTRSMLKEDGDVFVAINWNASPSRSDFDLLSAFGSLVDDAITATDTWPTRDLWSEYGYPQN